MDSVVYKKYINVAFIGLFAILLFSFAPKAHAGSIQPNVLTTLSCSGGPTNQCNAQCNASDTLTENRSFYFDGGFMGGYSVWSDDLGYAATLSGNWGSVDVLNSSHGVNSCDSSSVARGSAGDIGIFNLYTGWQDNDTMTIKILALNKQDNANKTYGGSTHYLLYTVSCQPGQYTVNHVCTDITGWIKVAKGGSGDSGDATLTCSASCNPDVHWRTTSGLGGYVTRNGTTINTNQDGDMQDTSNLSAGTYTYQLFVTDGFGESWGVDSATVTVVSQEVTPHATLSLSGTQVALSSSHTADSSVQISNENPTNDGSFSVSCSISSGSNPFPGGSISYTCPSSTGPISISTSNLSPTAGPYSAILQVTATGQNGTVISNSPQNIGISYSPASVVESCPSGYTGTPPNNCIPPPSPCPSGYTGTYPNCVAPPTQTTCPNGQQGNDYYLGCYLTSQQPTGSSRSSQSCYSSSQGCYYCPGGYWDGSSCQAGSPPPPASVGNLEAATDAHPVAGSSWGYDPNYNNGEGAWTDIPDGSTGYAGNWQHGLNGHAPLNNVSLEFGLPGSPGLYGVSEIKFSCHNDGNWDVDEGVDYYGYGGMYAINACSYPNPGTYTAAAEAWGHDNGIHGYAMIERYSDSITITVTQPACPSGSVSLSSSSVSTGHSVTASAPGGFSGGSFYSDNTGVASVSGSTVTGRSNGTANIYSSGWNNSNGATSCTLNSASLSVSNSPVNGTPGSASKTYPAGSTSYGSDTYCSAGTPNSTPVFPSPGTCVTWTCLGLNGGNNSGVNSACVPASQYSVTVTKTAGGSVKAADNSISCGSVCSKTYTNGTNVTLTATPDSSYWQFSGWSGDCTGTGQCVLNVTSAKNVNATFAPRNLQYQEF